MWRRLGSHGRWDMSLVVQTELSTTLGFQAGGAGGRYAKGPDRGPLHNVAFVSDQPWVISPVSGIDVFDGRLVLLRRDGGRRRPADCLRR